MPHPGRVATILGCLTALALCGAAKAGRVDAILRRGYLGCGVEAGVAGFASVDSAGRWSGFDVDICRVVAAAIFGSPEPVRFTETRSIGEFLANPDIDLVVRRLTWTSSRESGLSVMFGPVVFFDGQSFLAPKTIGVHDSHDLAGRTICVESGLDAAESWPRNLVRWSERHKLGVKSLIVADRAAGERAFFSGRCAVYSADRSLLGAIRADAPDPDSYAVSSRLISKEPLAPLMRAGDDQFFSVVRWSIYITMDAEELGVDSHTASRLENSADPDIRSLLGTPQEAGGGFGVPSFSASAIIRTVGNYGELYERNLGLKSRIRLDRGVNRLWTDGGLIYAPPVR